MQQRYGAISAAMRAVLATLTDPFTPADLRARVEQHVGWAVSQDTVTSFLSVACRSREPVVIQIEQGLYRRAT